MLPASKHRLHEFKIAQDEDTKCAQAKKWCTDGWPTKRPVTVADGEIIKFWKVISSFMVCDNLLLYN